ncbi:uncharacterized protein TRAVEDRAFT_48152 [Trametes versicolor FP-101664 SS1]|uniref:uncharacterized protein n=1 Tax=Trametes versicolor (strain FP-101664) TaxID=717944 RepID=UPI00046217D5|nr:uncharacterized protein TRAVEDRAFT_48152 [Trametes versicolor FP-101664 SS1]EIW59025.1 hypothetical protein TRAVEDRAFT_48152 [Trametes versicolor FP-101664 SS1]
MAAPGTVVFVPWTIPFNPVSPDGRVIAQKDAIKLVEDRIAFALRLEQSKTEAERFLSALEAAGKLRIPKENAFWISLCESYRWQFFEHQHRCQRLTEYIVHLHSNYARCRLSGSLPFTPPPMPEEISLYVEYMRRVGGVGY